MEILAIPLLILLPGLFLLLAMASAFFITIPLLLLTFFGLRSLDKFSTDNTFKMLICYGVPTFLSVLLLCLLPLSFQKGLEDEAGSFQYIFYMMVPFLWLYLTLFFAGVMKRLNGKTILIIFGIATLLYIVCSVIYKVMFP